MAADGFALLMVAIASAVFLDLPFESSRGGVIYVSTAGSDWNRGRSLENAVATIQHAANLVEPGGTVLILPGVYREEVRVRRGGQLGLPVTFKASTPGTVVISGEAAPEVVARLQWRDEGGKVWSAETPWPVYHVIGDDENFYHVRWADGTGDQIYHWKGTSGRVEILREMVGRADAGGAFTYEGGRLYIAYPDGASPRHHSTAIHREVPRPYASWSLRTANVWVEASHVRFEGIRFHFGVGSGLLLWNSSDVTVRECTFTGSMFGISNFPHIGRVKDLTIEHSFYHNYPQGKWLRGWLSWAEIYRHHSYSTLTKISGDRIVVRHNLVVHAGDGIELNTPYGSTGGIEIYGNLLAFGTDDALELDGFAKDIQVHDNVTYDFFVSLGLAPILSGPVTVRNNLFLTPAEGGVGAHFLLVNPFASRTGPLGGAIRNVSVTDNIFSGKEMCYCDYRGNAIENVNILRNLFIGVRMSKPLPAGVTFSENQESAMRANPVRPGTFCSGDVALKGTNFKTQLPGPSWLPHDTHFATREIPTDLWKAWQCN